MSDPRSREAKQQRAAEIYQRAVAVIGADAMARLNAAGLVVAGAAEFNNFVRAHAQESQRLRDLHAASERDAGRTSARAELILADGKIAALVTSPTCDEAHIGQCLAEALAPVVKDLITARFDPKTALAPEPARPPAPPVNAKGGRGLS